MSAGSLQPYLTNASFLTPTPVPTTWGDARPHSHLVQFYEDDGFLVDSLARWFDDGLRSGDSCVFIGTEDHRISLEKKLSELDIDLDTVRAHGRFLCLDAAGTLAGFMVDGWPDEVLFIRAIEGVLAAMSGRGNIRAFGEMVALLWKQGKPAGEPGQHVLSVIVSSQAEDLRLEADPARLRQVIANLIHNAAKFTPPGGRIDVLADRNDNEVIFRVRDSGIGISPDLLPHIFDLFTQGQRSLDRSHGGLGVGLTLVKRLVEMHGGRVQANSGGLGTGSEFEVHLPIAAMTRSRKSTPESKAGSAGRLRLLVVEDNHDAAEALTMLLELFGHDVTVVSEGSRALEAVRKTAFDVALVDIGLPGIDGYEVARRIRMIPNTKNLTLVALTGYGQDSDKQRALAAGFDEHLTKPVKIERLQALLNRPR